jgi:hypothetical protein
LLKKNRLSDESVTLCFVLSVPYVAILLKRYLPQKAQKTQNDILVAVMPLCALCASVVRSYYINLFGKMMEVDE